MWNWLKLDAGKRFNKGGVVPKSFKNLEPEIYSTDWNWLLYYVIHEPCDNVTGCKLTAKLLKPTGNWMLETKFNGTKTLNIEAEDEAGKTEYYSENCLKIAPEPQRIYIYNKKTDK